MENKDIRWKQRFSNYCKALGQLQKFIDKGELNELEQQGIIQSFEYTYELAWNVMKDFLVDKGILEIFGSRDSITEAFKAELIINGDTWMMMFKDRNKSAHTYNQSTADEISGNITNLYFAEFVNFKAKMESLI